MAAVQITENNFETEVLQADVPVLMDFWAPWCGPCKMLMPVIEELAGEASGYKVCKVNVDDEPELAARFRVMTIPTLMVFKGGEVAEKSVGVIGKAEILRMLEDK